jgi:hypothetical protein
MIDNASQANCAYRERYYRFSHPIFVFDISRRNGHLKDSPIDMKIEGEFNKNIPHNAHA